VFEELIKIMTFEVFPEDERLNFLSNPIQFINQKLKDKSLEEMIESEEEENGDEEEEDTSEIS
jgi:hypothetical protein